MKLRQLLTLVVSLSACSWNVLAANEHQMSLGQADPESPGSVEKPRGAESVAKKPQQLGRSQMLKRVNASAGVHPMVDPLPTTVCANLKDATELGPGFVPVVVADNLGRTHIVWAGEASTIWYAQIGSDGKLTIPATSVYDGAGSAFPNLAVDAAGDVHVVTTSKNFSFGGLIYFKISDGKRGPLSAFYMQPDPGWDEQDFWPSIAINPVTQLPVIAAEVHTSHLEPFGILNPILVPVYSTYITSVSLDAAGNPNKRSRFDAYFFLRTPSYQFNLVSYPGVTVDSLGRTHLVWIHREAGWTGFSIGYARAGSSEWIEIANNRNSSGLGSLALAAGLSGTVDIVWSTTESKVVWQKMDHSGLTLVDDAVVSHPGSVARWPRVASGGGKVVCSWTDGRKGANSQLYARSLTEEVEECNVSNSPGPASNGAVAVSPIGTPTFVWQDNRSGVAKAYYKGSVKPLMVFDANPIYLSSIRLDRVPFASSSAATVSSIMEILSLNSEERDEAVADGLTQLLLRFQAETPGTVNFAMSGADAVGYLRRIDSVESPSSVHTTLVRGKHDAFALYYVPNGLARRVATVGWRATFKSDDSTAPTQYEFASVGLERPPIVLVHGVWGTARDWSSTLLKDLNDHGFRYFAVDYHSIKSAAGAFSDYDGKIKADISEYLSDLRHQRIAVSRVDVVAHSMGGLLTRLAVNDPEFESVDSFYSGYVRRFITIDTPHWGSRAASVLLDIVDSNFLSWLGTLMPASGHPITEGGVKDLDPRTFGNSVSRGPIAIRRTRLPAFAFAATVSTLDQLPSTAERRILGFARLDAMGLLGDDLDALSGSLCGPRNFENELTFANSVFSTSVESFPHDGIVPLPSQIGGIKKFHLMPGVAHTAAPAEVGEFLIPLIEGSDAEFESGGFPEVSRESVYPQICIPALPDVKKSAPALALNSNATAIIQSLSLLTTNNQPGSLITMTVNILPDSDVTSVGFAAAQGSSILAFDTKAGPPYQFSFVSPSNSLNSILAVVFAQTASRKIDIQRTNIYFNFSNMSKVKAISLASSRSVLTGIGQSAELELVATLSDEVSYVISDPGIGLLYTSSDPLVTSVSGDGIITSEGNGEATIKAEFGGAVATLRMRVALRSPKIFSVAHNVVSLGESSAVITVTGLDFGGISGISFYRDGKLDTTLIATNVAVGVGGNYIRFQLSVATNVTPGLLTLVIVTPGGHSGIEPTQGNRLFVGSPLQFDHANIVGRDTGSSSINLHVVGITGSSCVIQTSSNLVNWVSMGTNILYGGEWNFEAISPAQAARQFFRAITADQ